MHERAGQTAQSFRDLSQQELMARVRTDLDKMMGILQPLTADEWTGLIVPHSYMGPVPAFIYAAGQLMDYGVHTWDIEQGTGSAHGICGEAADLLVPFMFVIWQYTIKPGADLSPFTVGIRVTSGQNAGDYRVSISDQGMAYEPGSVDVRPDERRHRARRRGAGQPVPEPVLQDLGGAYLTARPAPAYIPGPAGRRISSARCPSSPAALASSANPRRVSGSKPRSASAAPPTPAPFSGSVRPSIAGWTLPTACSSRRCGPRVPASSAMRSSPGVRGSPALCSGCPSPGTNRPAARWARTARSAIASKPASSAGSGPSWAASAAARNRPQSSVTPRNREPPPSSPAAIAPCTDSGAPVSVSRAAIVDGVNP